MKFGKSLSNQIEETLPEWRDKFLSYKELKKRLKLVYPDPKGGERQIKRRRLDAVVEKEAMTEEEMDFIQLLENELEKFNTFFVENEEEYIIRLKELQDRVAEAKDHNEEMMKIRKEVVDFHGEMVLLENYSALNYTGLVKILKKYEKRTGALIRLPFIQKVLQQPFFTTDLLDMLVKECERLLEKLLPLKEQAKEAEPHSPSISDAPLRRPREPSEMETRESIYMKRTVSALRVLKEIRSKSSTISMFSLPPLQTSGVDDAWKSVPAVEQAAK